MLADWYFCSVLRLTIHQTSEYLDTLTVFRTPDSETRLLTAALDWLADGETAVQLHALPSLLAAADRLRAEPMVAEQVVTLYTRVLESRDIGAEAGNRPEGSRSIALGGLLREMIHGPDNDFADRLLGVLAKIPSLEQASGAGADSRRPEPYEDMEEHISEAIALSLLDVAAQRDPSAVQQACVGGSRLAIVEDALGNRLGRWPLLLSASAVRRVSPTLSGSEVRQRLIEGGSGAGDLEPDLHRALALSWFGHPGDDSGPDLEVLEIEIATGLLFRQWPAGNSAAVGRRAAVRARLGVGATPDHSVRAVLWQLTLWELAVQHRADFAARLTRRWWGPPGDHRQRAFADQPPEPIQVPWPDPRPAEGDSAAYSDWLACAACVAFAPAAEVRLPLAPPGTPGADPSTVCSPWLDRKDNTLWHLRDSGPKERARLSVYSRSGEGLSLLRLLVTTSAAIRLLRMLGRARSEIGGGAPVDPRPRDHLIALLFHCRDVLTDTRLQFFLSELRSGTDRPADLPISSGLAGLAWHLFRTLDRAGQGSYPEIPVAWLADFLLDGPGVEMGGDEPGGGKYGGVQWARLFSVPALQIARYWIEETASGIRRSPDSEAADAGWFDGAVPYARRVLATAIETLQQDDRARKAAAAAAQLLRQHFPMARVEADVDWMTQLPRLSQTYRNRVRAAAKSGTVPSSPLNFRLLLAADPYPLDQWLEHSAEIANITPGGAERTAMLTVRLIALLSESAPGLPNDVPAWVDEWFDIMSAVNDPNGWARATRSRALDIFQLPQTVPAGQDRMRKVLEAVIDAIVEFSASAPRYYQLLLDALAAEGGPLPVEGMDRLRVRVVYAIRYHLVGDRGTGTSDGPWGVVRQRVNRNDIENLLRSFVALTGTGVQAWNDRRTMGHAFLDSWCRVTVGPGTELILRSARNHDDSPDPRLVVARVLDRYTGTEQCLVLDRAIGRRADGAEVVDLLTLEPAERRHKLAQWRKYRQAKNVTCVVCAVVGTDPAGRTFLVNWGSGTPIRVVDTSEQAPGLGTVGVLTVHWSESAQDWMAVDGRPLRDAGRPAPRPGEIREARVRIGPGAELSVLVKGIRTNILRKRDNTAIASAHWRWDPDLSRALCARTDTDPEPQSDETLARWDADYGQWFPEDRTLTELIAGDLPYRSADGLAATVLVYLGPGDPARLQESGRLRFATRPGRCFLLDSSDWLTGPAELEAVLRHGPGVLVYAALAGTADPRLLLLADPPEGADDRWPALATGTGCDTRNVDWLALFNSADEHLWEAQLRDGQWILDVSEAPRYPRGLGFPGSVSVAGLETMRDTRCPFSPEPWDESGARRCEVAGEPLQRESLPGTFERPSLDEFNSLTRIERKSKYRMRRFRRGRVVRNSYIDAEIENGLTVRVERDSLPFTTPPSITPETVEITNVRSPHSRPARSAHSPLAPEQLGKLLTRPLVIGERVRAVVFSIDRDVKGVPERFGIWLEAGGVTAHATLAAGCFTHLPCRVGDTCTGTLTEAGWEFASDGREIYARVLHERKVVDVRPGVPWRYLGWFQDRGKTGYELYADPRGGPLLTVRQPRDRGIPPLGLHARAVARLGGGVPRQGTPTYRVRVATGGIDLVGDATSDSDGLGVVSRVELVVWLRRDGLLDFRRELTVTRVVKDRVDPGVEAEAAGHTIEDEWREQLAAGEVVHVQGSFAAGAMFTARTRLPMVDGDAPYVAGNSYSDKRIAAQVVERDGVLYADTRLAPPYSPRQFADEVADVPPGTRVQRRDLSRYVYYVGTEEVGSEVMRRFEWGRGYTVLFGPAEITVRGRPCHEQAFPLFHGDRLVRADFRLDDQNRTVLNIEPEQDVEIQTATQVFQEAEKHIVHRLVVEVDPEAGRVTVKQVRVRRTRITDDADQSQRRGIVADLDDESKRQILAELATSPRSSAELAQLEILARFDRADFLRRRGRERRFFYVQSRFAAPGGRQGIASNEHILMVAGDIKRPNDNDTYLEFRLPDVLRMHDTPPLTVSVARAKFSCREYLLPRLFEEGHKEYYKDSAVMLVKIVQGDRDKRWYGDLTQQPAREQDTLAGAVSQAGGSLLAALSDRSGRRVELRPGVICELGAANGFSKLGKPGRGALVRISRSDGRLHVVLAQRPDRDYIEPSDGRPALLLPKQPLLGRQGLAMAGEPGRFTVAGLPAVSVTAGLHGETLLRTAHPKLGMVRFKDGSVVVEPPSSAQVRAAKVETSGDQPRVRTVEPFHTQSPGSGRHTSVPARFVMPWALLSFCDTDMAGLRERAENSWNYHDLKTWHWVGSRRPQPYDITGRTLAREPVFFDEHGGTWTLRYRPSVIGNFGVPATALTERRVIAQSAGDEFDPDGSEWFTVACSAVRPGQRFPWGLWIELSPGRVVELGGPLLVGPDLMSLDDFAWEQFGAGDLVRLQPVRRNFTQPGRFRLIDWRPGPRSALLPEPLSAAPGSESSGRALLTVESVDRDRGGLTLGSGGYTMRYPISPAEAGRYRPGHAVLLHRTNHLTPGQSAALMPGDTALLAPGRGDTLQLLGRRGLRPEPAPDAGCWPGTEWLAELLRGAQRCETLRACGGCIPVTIERVTGETVEFSRRLQPSGEWQQRKLIRGMPTGIVGDRLLLRTGGAIFRISMQEIVRCLPDAYVDAAARVLVEQRHPVWCRPVGHGPAEARRLETRLPDQRRAVRYIDEFDAKPLAVIGTGDTPSGLLLHGLHDQSYRWMPVGEASWLESPSIDELETFLVRPGLPLRVREDDRGEASITRRRAVRHQFDSLTLGDKLRIEACALPRTGRIGRSTAVASVSGSGLLLRIAIEPRECVIGEPIHAEVAELGGKESRFVVNAVRSGHRLRPVDLPARLATGAPAAAARVHDRLAVQFAAWWNGGPVGETDGAGSDEIEGLLRAASGVVSGAVDERTDRALDRWLAASGEAAFNLRSVDDIEVAPLLAACLLLARRGELGDAVAAGGAVLLAHQTGLRATRSLHVEQIVRHWLPLGRGIPVRTLSAHNRLAALQFSPELDSTQLRTVLWFGHGVLSRVSDGSLDDGSAPIARAALAAVGHLPPDSDLALGADILAPLAGLGRALHPPKDEAIAQQRLWPDQLAELRLLLRRAIELPVPLLPLPQESGPCPPSRRLALSVLRSAQRAADEAPSSGAQ